MAMSVSRPLTRSPQPFGQVGRVSPFWRSRASRSSRAAQGGSRFDNAMSANQTTAARLSPARRSVGRELGRLLEENGPLVMVVAAFGLVMLLALRNALTIDGWMALASG